MRGGNGEICLKGRRRCVKRQGGRHRVLGDGGLSAAAVVAKGERRGGLGVMRIRCAGQVAMRFGCGEVVGKELTWSVVLVRGLRLSPPTRLCKWFGLPPFPFRPARSVRTQVHPRSAQYNWAREKQILIILMPYP